MAGYMLEAGDNGATYPIPQGETMIGRGPFLGISDKRVSRNHAVLEVVDDKLRIKPVHVNPCFYRASCKDAFVPLKRDEWCLLNSGDSISLLPDKLSFRVIAKHHLQEATLRNSQALDEDCAVNDSSCSTNDSGAKTKEDGPSCSGMNASKPVSSPPLTKCDERKEENCSDLSSASNYKMNEQSRPAPRKRILPKWMLQGDLMIQNLPSPVGKAGKKRRNVTSERTEKTVENVTKKKEPQPKNWRDDGEEGVAKKSKAAVQTEDLPGTSSIPARLKNESSRERVIEDEDNEEEEMEVEHCDYSLLTKMESNGSPDGSVSTKPCNSSESQAVNNAIRQSAISPQNAQQTAQRRTPCMYADRCYRKNPVHFEEFSHPGDSDYNDMESGSQDDNDDDDRPECPYGTDCYRKNPQHKLEYKHTKPPGRRLRKRPAKKAKSALNDDSDDDGEPNEYDLEDSFIDDDEEDEEDFTDEDSDWIPDSEEKDSEDMKQLLKEAKRIVKGNH